MAEHDVKFPVPRRPLGKADVEFRIERNGTLLGHLMVSNGAIEWAPRSKKNRIKLSWADFDELMRKNG